MSTYSIASRLIWKKGCSYTLRPDLLSTSTFDLRSNFPLALWTCSKLLTEVSKLSSNNCQNPACSFRSYSSASSSSGKSGNGGGDNKDDIGRSDSVSCKTDDQSTNVDTDKPEVTDVKYDPKEDTFFTQDIAYGKKENKGQGNPERPYFEPPNKDKDEVEEELETPTNCCRSGCPNCVWIDYVEKLTAKFMDPELSRERILKDLETIDDQSIKAFVMMELRSKGLL